MTKSVYEDLIKVLKRRPSQTEWDDDLEREYTVVTQSMSDETGLAIIKRIVMECEMRPVSATLVRFAREITGDTKSEIKALGVLVFLKSQFTVWLNLIRVDQRSLNRI